MSTEIITHNSETYTFDSESTTDAVVEYLGDGPLPYPYQCYYEFELSGAHEGPAIKVRMVDPSYEFGTDGAFCPTWSKLLFADDGSDVLANANCGEEFNESDRDNYARWIIGQALVVPYAPMTQRFTAMWKEAFQLAHAG
jgi:hypothetical protein